MDQRSSRPSRQRPKKTNITRTRTGCYTCRRRRIKCDEKKPICKACTVGRFECEGYVSRYKFTEPASMAQVNTSTYKSVAWVPALGLETKTQESASCSTQKLQGNSPLLGYGGYFELLDGLTAPSLMTMLSSAAQNSGPLVASSSSQVAYYDEDFPDALSFIETDLDFGDGTDSISVFLENNSSQAKSQSDESTSSVDFGGGFYQEALSDNSRNVASPQDISAYSRPDVRVLNSSSQTSATTNKDDLYFTHWYTCVLKILPPVFRDLTFEAPDFSPLRNAILAISASNLAHVQSSIVSTNHGKRKSRYIPQQDHQYESLNYYGKGVRELAILVSLSSWKNPHYVLATSLLFSYFEIDSGSFSGAIKHMSSIDYMVCSEYQELNSGATGQKLLCTWMSLRSLIVNRHLAGGLGSESTLSSLNVNNLDPLVAGAATPYDSVIRLLCRCLLTTRKMILDWCVCRSNTLTTEEKKKIAFRGFLQQDSLPESREPLSQELAAIDEGYYSVTEQQRGRLDIWHSQLDISELPIDSYTSRPSTGPKELSSSAEFTVHPLKFQTHETAMNYAYYATAQMLSSSKVLERIAGVAPVSPIFTREEYPWEKLILRITAGLDLADCVYKNAFNIGILSLLLLCASWCPHPGPAQWANEWVRQLEDCGMAIEDGLPLGVMKRILGLVMKRKMLEQDLYMISILGSEDIEKSDLYESEFIVFAALCGKNRRTGKLYNDVVHGSSSAFY